MRIYSLGGFYISQYVKKIRDVSDICVKDPDCVLVCSSSCLDRAVCNYAKSNPGCRLVVVGCDLDASGLDMVKDLPSTAKILPLHDSFGSAQFLFKRLKDGSVPAKGLMRFVKCGRYSDDPDMMDEISFDFSSISYLLSSTMGKVVSRYGKVFRDENLLRFNSILRFENGSILFFEHKFSYYMPDSLYWEYGYRDGLMVSDSFKELPLLVLSDCDPKTLDPFRITGNEQRIAQTLLESSLKMSEFTSSAGASTVCSLLAEFGLKGGAR